MVLGLCRLIGARQGSTLHFTGFSPDGLLTLLSSVHGGWASPASAAAWDRALKIGNWRGDPILNQAVQVPGRLRTRLRGTLIDDAQWYSSQGYNEIAKPMGTDDALVCWYRRREPTQVRGLAFQRAYGDDRFSARERNILHLFNVELYRLYREGKFDCSPGIPSPSLSPRQKQMLDLLLKGKSVKEAAVHLGISWRTAEDYVKSLYKQLAVTSRAELFARFSSLTAQ
jgi:DNA-binding CsgD family transcriptional regulator